MLKRTFSGLSEPCLQASPTMNFKNFVSKKPELEPFHTIKFDDFILIIQEFRTTSSPHPSIRIREKDGTLWEFARQLHAAGLVHDHCETFN